jgi:ketosteroid isomerase-like protein
MDPAWIECPGRAARDRKGTPMKRTGAVLAILLVSAWAAAAMTTLSADANEAAEAEIKQLEMRLAGLLVSGDFDAYEHFLAADYTRINAAGVVETRDQVLAAFRASPRVGSMEPTELDVKTYGDTAILTGKLTISSPDGIRQSRFRKVFIQRDGRWFLVSLQGTALRDAR